LKDTLHLRHVFVGISVALGLVLDTFEHAPHGFKQSIVDDIVKFGHGNNDKVPRIWVKRRHEVSFVAAQVKARFAAVIGNKISPCLGQPAWVIDS
jgi:hypothetical protein